MSLTVKQVSDLAGVSVRTLHYYDEIDLFSPSYTGANGYRYYDEDALIRLQQILFFRELGFSLAEIKTLLDDPGFDVLVALDAHRQALRARIRRLNDLVQTIDHTLSRLKGDYTMSDQDLFRGFSREDEERYHQEARERWDSDMVDGSYQRWNSYSEERKQAILQEQSEIYQALADHMADGPDSPTVQALLGRWHAHMRNFYEPTPEMLAGLGAMYHDDPAFNATFTQIDPALPAFLKNAIAIYVAGLD